MAPVETPTNSPACTEKLREALSGAASALQENDPRLALAGSYALWAYGTTEPSHDVDPVVAAATLTEAAFSIEQPPQDWLFKPRTGDTVVDVLHRINGVPVESASLDRAEQRDVLAIQVPVLPRTMVLVQKLRTRSRSWCWRSASA